MTGRWLASVIAIVLLASASPWGQAKTDVVTLANGDRITGEIVSVSHGRLELKTDDAGTIDIEWEKIARAESTRQFEIITVDGRRLLGNLKRSEADRSVLIVGIDGDVLSLPIHEVTSMVPIGTSFWTKLDGSVDAGFTYTRSSGIAQTTLNSNTLYRRPSFTFQVMTSATLTQRSDESERDDRGDIDASYVRYRGGRWFVKGGGRLETNESLGLVLRSQLSGAVGLRLVNTNRALFRIGGGLAVNDERNVDTPPTQNLEAIFDLATSYYTYDAPKTDFSAQVQYYPSLSSWGRQRLQIDARVKRDVWKDFFVSANLFNTFDSAPPTATAANNDVGVSVSAGWSY